MRLSEISDNNMAFKLNQLNIPKPKTVERISSKGEDFAKGVYRELVNSLRFLPTPDQKISENQREAIRKIKRAIDILDNYENLPEDIKTKIAQTGEQDIPNKENIDIIVSQILSSYDLYYSASSRLEYKRYGIDNGDAKRLLEILNEKNKNFNFEKTEYLFQRTHEILYIIETLNRDYKINKTGITSLYNDKIQQIKEKFISNLNEKRQSKYNEIKKEFNLLNKVKRENLDDYEKNEHVRKYRDLVQKINNAEDDFTNINKIKNKEIKNINLDKSEDSELLLEDVKYWEKLSTLKSDLSLIIHELETGIKPGPSKEFKIDKKKTELEKNKKAGLK